MPVLNPNLNIHLPGQELALTTVLTPIILMKTIEFQNKLKKKKSLYLTVQTLSPLNQRLERLDWDNF